MPITMLYTGLLGAVFLVLSIRVIVGRGRTGANIGDEGKPGMLRLMRGHANFAEYVPLILIMMALLESQGTAAGLLHVLGATLLVARLAHGYTFAFSSNFPPGRIMGASLTLLVLLAASGLCVWQALGAL